MTKRNAIAVLIVAIASRAIAAPVTPSERPRGTDLAGVEHIFAKPDAVAVAFVFLNPECPISNQYLPELNRIANEFVPRKVQFLGIVADASVTLDRLKSYQKDFSISFPILDDRSLTLARRFRPTHVPEAFVLDGGLKLRYRGRIDDQFASIGKRRANVSNRDLREALEAVADGRTVANSVTEPVGCIFESLTPESAKGSVTYSKDIAIVFRRNCVTCHRPGEVAPFSLASHEEAAKRVDMIREVIQTKRMPPWRPAPGFGHFLGERSLSDRDRKLIARWAELGAPAGALDEVPPTPEFADGWQLGVPDLVLKMPEPYTVPADGPDIFRYMVLPLNLPEDKEVVAVEFRPGNPRVTHHSVMFLDTTGVARKKDAADPGPGYKGSASGGFRPAGLLGFWAPGYTPRYLPDGAARRVPKNADVAMQMHYHPSGKSETDQSSVGVYFARKPATLGVGEFAMGSLNIDIPAGEKKHRLTSTFTLPRDVRLYGVTPHMHMIGTEMKVTATLPDGRVEPVIWINDWDFNWQDQYLYSRPVELPKGTRFDLEAYYDNSADNPANPNSPPKRMQFGLETDDEMCLCAFHFLSANLNEDRKALERSLVDSFRKEMSEKGATPLVRFLLKERLRVMASEGKTLKPTEAPTSR